MNETHPDLESLATLAEGVLSDDAAAPLRAHLIACRGCFSAYADVVRYRAAGLARPDAFAPAGRGPRAYRTVFRELYPATHSASFFRRGALLLGVALTCAVVAFGWMARSERWSEAVRLPLPPAVRTANERVSADGMVLPGAGRDPQGAARNMRSGVSVNSAELEAELGRALAGYENGNKDPGSGAQLIAALVATGEWVAARNYAEECLAAHPDHVPTLLLASSVAYRLNQLDEARSLLERARARQPRSPLVQYNLALVLQQQGRTAEARTLLRQVSRSSDRWLAGRAVRELGVEK